MYMKKMVSFIAAALMLLFAGQATAAEISVMRTDGVGESVSAWKRSGREMILFLPAYMRGSELEITHSGVRGVRFGEMELESGAATSVLTDGKTLQTGSGAAVKVMASRNLPAVHLTTKSGSLDYIHEKKGNKEKGFMRIVTAAGETDFEAEVDAIKGHGNATFVYEKKSYQVKLDKKASLLGMDEGKTYVLLANQHENALVRNRITFALADALGLPFTPDCASVDLYVNGEYRGNYLLCDKVGISSGSVDITESEDALEFANEAYVERGGEPVPYGSSKYEKGTYKGAAWPREPEDITGGFLFELEYRQRYADEASGMVTTRGQAVVVKEPEEMSAAQGEYAYRLLSSFENAIFAADGTDALTGLHYTEIADFDSLVRKYMIEEVCKNYDGNKSSQYFFKDSDAVDPFLYAGPVWDYDSAWGNYAQEGRLKTAAPEGLGVAEGGEDYSWWPALYGQQDFRAEVRRVWESELRAMLETLAGVRGETHSGVPTLDRLQAELEASAAMNFARWRVLNHSTRAVKTGATYEENIEYLRSWILDRIAYLDGAW